MEAAMSLIERWNLKRVLIALALVTATVLLAAPTADARVGFGITLGFPPIVAPPPVVVAPPVAVGPPPYYALPPGYYYAPGYGYYWYDRWGRRHWAHY
jgi:hypothetical protein